jgi:hypothetical protein
MNNKQIGSISARVTKRNKNGPAAVLKQRTFDLVPPAVFCSCPILGSSRIKKISQVNPPSKYKHSNRFRPFIAGAAVDRA